MKLRWPKKKSIYDVVYNIIFFAVMFLYIYFFLSAFFYSHFYRIRIFPSLFFHLHLPSAIRKYPFSFYRRHYEIDKKLKARHCHDTSGVYFCAEIAIRFAKPKKKIYYLGCMVLIAIRDSIFQKHEYWQAKSISDLKIHEL